MSAAAPVLHRRRWLLGAAAIGTAAVSTTGWRLARRPMAEAPAWWPSAFCLSGTTAMTPAKLRRAQRRERAKLRAPISPADPA